MSITNPATNAATNAALSHVRMIRAVVRGRQWRTNSQKNLAVKVRLAFLIRTLGFNTQYPPQRQ